ncbi:MAG: AbrB/MazE/SpoVT family DNA-binding domain-containing protein [Dermatophilaceae bacterium]
MTTRVGPKGQVVIPKELRDRLGIRPGDRLHFWLDGDHVAARPARPRTPLRGRFQGIGLASGLEASRRREREEDGE